MVNELKMMYTPTSSATKLVISIPMRIAETVFSSAWPRASGRWTWTPEGSWALNRCCSVSMGTSGEFMRSMRSKLRPRSKTTCAEYTSMTAMFPPKISPMPIGLNRPWTVNVCRPFAVNRSNVSPILSECRAANARETISEFGCAR